MYASSPSSEGSRSQSVDSSDSCIQENITQRFFAINIYVGPIRFLRIILPLSSTWLPSRFSLPVIRISRQLSKEVKKLTLSNISLAFPQEHYMCLTKPFQSPSVTSPISDPTASRGSLDSTWPPGHLESTWQPPGHLAASGSLQSRGSARQAVARECSAFIIPHTCHVEKISN